MRYRLGRGAHAVEILRRAWSPILSRETGSRSAHPNRISTSLMFAFQVSRSEKVVLESSIHDNSHSTSPSIALSSRNHISSTCPTASHRAETAQWEFQQHQLERIRSNRL